MSNENKIRKLAYKLYLKKGHKNGRDLEDWVKAEEIILRRDRFFKFLRHPLFLIFVSSVVIWGLQQQYLKNEDMKRRRFEIIKTVSPLVGSYYQETWNQWYAFRDKTPSEKYRTNIQRIVVEAKAIQAQLPILFKDKITYEDWNKILRIFWEANYPISREGISEQELNNKLNLVNPLINDMLGRMCKESK